MIREKPLTRVKIKMETEMIGYPLMQNNITRDDLDAVIKHLQQDDPILTKTTGERQLVLCFLPRSLPFL